MTLVLTAITRQSIVQVADMRLTNRRTGRVADEATAKMVFYAGRFVLSFTGPAWMGSEPTAQWIASVLSGLTDPARILVDLAQSAQEIVRRYPPAYRHLAIVGAGWLGDPASPRPISIQVANFDFESGVLMRDFHASGSELDPNQKVRLFAAGVPLPPGQLAEVENLMRRRAGRREERPGEFVAMLVRLARQVAFSNPAVGTDLLVGSIPGVKRDGGPPIFETGMSMPLGAPDWRGATYFHVRRDATRVTMPVYAAPGFASSGGIAQFGGAFLGVPQNS
jgi:hypothetical protein